MIGFIVPTLWHISLSLSLVCGWFLWKRKSCEWGAFKHLNDTDILRSVDQLSIELHFPQHKKNAQGPGSGVREVFEFFEVVERAGLRAFSWEVNHNPSGYWGEKPWAIEYSFVRPSSDYLTHRPF
mmetsp:Transcript_23589/g.46966  ORF Transcript_23589/g.46966 Transcript_23589/m.46966 type:complete len:125 (+) Transcript_23589:73-447(+)